MPYDPLKHMLQAMDIGYRLGMGLRPDLSREAEVGKDMIDAMQKAYEEEEREETSRARGME